MNANMTMTVSMPRRSANFTVTSWAANKYNLDTGKIYFCHVLGIFQEGDKDGTRPVAVVELTDGTVLSAGLEFVKFIDTDEKGEILK